MIERKGIFSIEDTFNALGDAVFIKKGRVYVNFYGEEIHANSQRYQVFRKMGTTCPICGLQGQYFALEKSVPKSKKIKATDTNNYERFHLNLYGIDANGKEVLFTKDHIIPKSKGGKNTLDNYQPMCQPCNERKKDIM